MVRFDDYRHFFSKEVCSQFGDCFDSLKSANLAMTATDLSLRGAFFAEAVPLNEQLP